MEKREIRADYDDRSIVVYQPSFRWMMYRCGYATKPGQERVLAVRITREGFDWAVANAVESNMGGKPSVRVQWDPERGLKHQPLPHRSVQIGLTREATRAYVDEWTLGITDTTPLAHQIGGLVRAGDLDAAEGLLPPERPYEPRS